MLPDVYRDNILSDKSPVVFPQGIFCDIIGAGNNKRLRKQEVKCVCAGFVSLQCNERIHDLRYKEEWLYNGMRRNPERRKRQDSQGGKSGNCRKKFYL